MFALVALYWSAAPLMACVTPQTAEQRECCRKMAELCGAAQMPQSHSCCRTQERSTFAVYARSNPQPAPLLSPIAYIAVLPLPQTREGVRIAQDHHPPAEFLPDTTVLRI